LCSPAKAFSEDVSRVADAFGHSLAVKVFEQGNGVLAAHASHVFERSDVDGGGLRLMGADLASELFQCGAVKNEIVGDFDQRFFPQKKRHDLLGAYFVDLETG
jgi:hypothetical protein